MNQFSKTFLRIFLILFAGVSFSFSATNLLINQNKFASVAVLDSFTISFDFAAGETCVEIEVWFDANENEVIDPEVDYILFNSADEGEKFCDGNAQDGDGNENGSFSMIVDEFFPLAPAQFIFKVEDNGGSDTAILYQVQFQSQYIVKGKVIKPPNVKNLIISANPVIENRPPNLLQFKKAKPGLLAENDNNFKMEIMTLTDSTGAYVLYLPAPKAMEWAIRSYDIFRVLGMGWLAPSPVKHYVNGILEDIDFVYLQSEACISGNVTDEDMTQLKTPEGDVLEAWIFARENRSQYTLETQTQNGSYVLPVVAGNYEVMVNFEAPDYMFPPSKQNIYVESGDSLSGIDFIAYKANAQISGHVTENQALPLAGIEIQTHHQQAGSARAYTNNQGYYSLRVSDKVPDYQVELPMHSVPGHLIIEGGNVRQVPPGAENVDFHLIPREYNEAPNILKIQDIPHDQGLQVRVIWQASGFDFTDNHSEPVQEYGVWRGVPPTEVLVAFSKNEHFKIAKSIETMLADIQNAKPGDCYLLEDDSLMLWDFINRVPAVQLPQYSVVAPTLGDSTAAGIYYTYFMISAHMQNSNRHFFSKVERGYSVDNLRPPKPVVFARFSENSVVLTWDHSEHPDVIQYNVYREENHGFTPGKQNQIGYTPENQFTDEKIEADRTYYYRIEAVDDAQNSALSDEIDVNLADVAPMTGGSIPREFALHPNYPNPFNAVTAFRFDLPEDVYVEIMIYNLLGTEIAKLVQGMRKAGTYQIHWDGKNAKSLEVASGIYFCKMKTDHKIFNQKMLLLR